MKLYNVFSGAYPFKEQLGTVLAPNDSAALAHAIKMSRGLKDLPNAMANHPVVQPVDGINIVNELKGEEYEI